MKLKDLIGIVPNGELVSINAERPEWFEETDWELLSREVRFIRINTSNFAQEVLEIGLQD